MIKPLLCSLVLILVSRVLFGQGTYTSTGVTSNWNLTTTWSGDALDSPNDGIPDANDIVIIATGHTVNVNVASSCSNLIMNGTALMTGTNTLAVGGTLTLNGNSQISTGTYTVAGTFSVPAGQIGTFGGIDITINGTTSIGGYFFLGISGTGTKRFNNTITVNAGGTWDNVVGEDPIVNCSIVNSGSWPVPTGGNGRYNVTSGGPYTYTGNTEIAMTRLNIQNSFTSTVTNLGILRLSKNGVDALSVTNAAATFFNGDGVSNALLRLASFATTVDASGNGTVNFSRTNNTVDYLYGGNQNVYGTTYYNLTLSTSGIKTLQALTTVTNSLTIQNSAILDANTQTLNGTANLTMTGTSELRLAKNNVTVPELTGASNSLGSSTTITFNGSGNQTAKSSATFPYQNVNVSGSGASTLDFSAVSSIAGNLVYANSGQTTANPVLTIGGTFNYGSSATTSLANNMTTGNFIFSAGTLDYSGRTITINGNNGTWTFNGGGSFVNALSTVVFTTGTNQRITGTASTSFVNLVINNSNNVTLNGVDASATTSLTLTNGNLITGSRFVSVSAGGTVARTNGWVYGNLRKNIPLGAPTVTFEVGGATSYTPVTLDFTGVSTSNNVTVSTTDGIHPDINGSNIEPNKSVNRYWTFTNNATVFTSYNATFNYVAGDKDALFDFSTAQIHRTNGISWFTTTPGTRTSLSTQFTGESAVNLPNGIAEMFAIGNDIVTTGILNSQTGVGLNWSNQQTWIQNRTGNIQFTNGSATVTGTGTSFLTELSNGDVIMLQTNPSLAQRYTVLSRATNTSLTLTTNATATNSGGYGKEYVPNAIGDVVTIGNTNIADAATTVSLNMNATVNTLNLNITPTPLNNPQQLTHSGGNALTVQTNVFVNQPNSAGTNAWNINGGSATVGGSVTIGSAQAGATKVAQVTITTGSLNVGNVIYNTTANSGDESMARIDMSGGAGGVLNLNGSFSFVNNRGRLIPGAGTNSTVNFNRTSSGQTLDMSQPNSNAAATNFIFSNLLFNNTSSGGVTITGSNITTTNVTGNFRVQTGTVFTDDNVGITGGGTRTFTVDPGAVFEMKGASSTFPTGYGTFNLGTTAPFGTVRYNQTAPASITIANRSYGNLTCLRSGITFAFTNTAVSIAGSLTIGDGTSTPTVTGAAGACAPTVNRDVIINANATLDAASSQINNLSVGGNWTNNGTFTSGGGGRTVTFIGTGPSQPQVISGTSATSFNRMTINSANTTDLVQMNTNVTVSNVLTLTKGGLALNGNTLFVTSSATTAIASGGAFPSQGYIKSESTSAPYGEVNWATGNQTGSFVYPFGKSSTEFIPLTINKTVGGAPASGTISAWTYASATNNTPLPTTVGNLNGTSGGNSVADRFWGVTLSGYTTTRPVATLTFTAVGGSTPITTPPSERPGTKSDLTTVTTSPAGIAAQAWNPAAYWDAATAGQTFANNSPNTGFFQVTAPAVTLQNAYVPWALADASVPLPIELLKFEAVPDGNRVALNWITASELNNDFFSIETSATGEKFSEILTVKGAGTRNSESIYSAYDQFPKPGISYYRLKQTDFNKVFTYSRIVKVEMPNSLFWNVYPNPVLGTELYIRFLEDDLGSDVQIKVSDVSGHELFAKVVEDLDHTDVRIDLGQKLSGGMYILSVAAGKQIVRQKIVVSGN